MKKFILLFTCLIFVYSVASAAENTAFQKYKKYAEQGVPRAQCRLGRMYYNGRGVAKDYKKAKYWLNKAYENNDLEVTKKVKSIWNKFELGKY